MPKYQGELDGLCGPYAIANAFEHCGFKCFDDAFKQSCLALQADRWPSTIWGGTNFWDIKRMIIKCRKNIDMLQGVEVSWPFHRDRPKDDAQYWDRFDRLFVDESAKCAILGVSRPSYHWIVASLDGKRIQFTDSTAGAPFVRKNRSSLSTDEENSKPGDWLIERGELFLFTVSPN